MKYSPVHNDVDSSCVPDAASLRHVEANAASPTSSAICAPACNAATYIPDIQAISPNQVMSSVLGCGPSMRPSGPASWLMRNSSASLICDQLPFRNEESGAIW